jgi:hypothetical protein
MRNSSVIGRAAALAAVVVAVAAVAVILLSGGSSYQVKAVFANASQIVTGDLVEVSGNSIGTVSNIALTNRRRRSQNRSGSHGLGGHGRRQPLRWGPPDHLRQRRGSHLWRSS